MEKTGNNSVDLLDILSVSFAYIKRFISKTINILGWIARFIYAHKAPIFFFVAIGFVLAYFLSNKENRVYKASSDVFINIEDSYFFHNTFDKLDAYCKNVNKNFIASSFGISNETAKSFISIRPYYVIDEQLNGTPDWVDFKEVYTGKDTTSMIMKDRIHVEVLIKDTSLLKFVPSYIQKHLETMPNMKEKNALRLMQMDAQMASIKNEITMLDSLRRLEYFKRNRELTPNQDKMVIFNEKDKKLYHTDMLDLQRKLNELEWSRKINKDFIDFGSGFTLEPKAVNGRIKIFSICGSIGLIIGFIITLLFTSRGDIKKYLEK